jgi:hypothetical protein
MATENLLVDNGCHGKAIETVGESLPQLDVVAPFALIVKAVYSVD